VGFFQGILNNNAITIPVFAWFVAQAIKVVLGFITEKRINFSRFVGSGGMPSSHSAFAVSLATVVGKRSGWDSTIFAVALAFALVVMYDAAGIRRAAGKQARVLNDLISMHMTKIQLEEKLKELLGHTPLEVVVGALLGIFITILLC